MTKAEPIRIEGLSISDRKGNMIVAPVDLELQPGKVTLIVGASSSGKTTIGCSLSGLARDVRVYRQLSGQVRRGTETYDLANDSPALGGMVFQDGALFDDLSVVDNIAIARDHGHDATFRDSATTLISDVLGRETVRELSGGERQRVAIARTMIAGSKLLILDEPNSGLDVANSRSLAKEVRRLCDDEGYTAVVIAHHIADLLPIADQVFLVDREQHAVRRLPPKQADVEEAILEESLAARAFSELSESVFPARGIPKSGGLMENRWQFLY